MMVKLVNKVILLDFHCQFDLTFLSRNLKVETEYSPKEFHWLKTWFGEERKYVAFYESGKCLLPGIKSNKGIEKYSSMIENKLTEIMKIQDSPSIETKNTVYVSNLNNSLNLEKIAIGLGLEKIEYEPEQFPALVYNLDRINCVFLIFSSGKIVITGIKDKKTAEEGLKILKKQLRLI